MFDLPIPTFVLIAAVVLLPLALIGGALYASVLSMSRDDLKLQPVGPDERRDYYAIVGAHHAFAKSAGFAWVGGYLFSATNTLFVAAWRHQQLPSYFCIYCHGATKHFDFVTIYSDDEGLTTASTKDAHTLPHRPGSYVESLPGAQPEELWAQHRRSMKFIERNFGLVPGPRNISFEEEIVTAIRGQMAHVRSLFAWPVRGIFWYLVGRTLKQGRTIEQQYGGK
ncbi:MAG: hypothetical protein WD648_05405 [Planctomycetaceae bacterium]